MSGAIGIVMGLLPHVFSVPLLRRLHRRFGTWKAPAFALVLFAVTFSLSAFVVGPAFTDGSPVDSPTPTPTQTATDHTTHHS